MIRTHILSILLLLETTSFAQTVMIDFEHLFSCFSEIHAGPLRMTNARGTMCINEPESNPNAVSNGSQYCNDVEGLTIVHSWSGGVFSPRSIDIAEYSQSTATPALITFTGTRYDGITMTVEVPVDGIADGPGGEPDFQPYTFPTNFQDLIKLEVTNRLWSFDNFEFDWAEHPPIQEVDQYQLNAPSLVNQGSAEQSFTPGRDGALYAIGVRLAMINGPREMFLELYLADEQGLRMGEPLRTAHLPASAFSSSTPKFYEFTFDPPYMQTAGEQLILDLDPGVGSGYHRIFFDSQDPYPGGAILPPAPQSFDLAFYTRVPGELQTIVPLTLSISHSTVPGKITFTTRPSRPDVIYTLQHLTSSNTRWGDVSSQTGNGSPLIWHIDRPSEFRLYRLDFFIP